MLTVDDYAKIRIAHRDGMSIRALARTFGHSRRKVRAILANPQPTPYSRAKPKAAPVLGSFHAVIDAVLAGYTESIGQRFAHDQAKALPLPAHPFDACVSQAAQADKYQTVRFDRNRYSVPRTSALRSVTVKGYLDRVEVVERGQVVARHARSYGRDQQVLDPLHYLATLERRPAALDHAPVLRDRKLPEAFAQLRQAFEQRHGPSSGAARD